MIVLLLLRDLDHLKHEVICRTATRRLQRNEAARMYHYKRLQKLAPKRVVQRE
jgi:hypothetical protein